MMHSYIINKLIKHLATVTIVFILLTGFVFKFHMFINSVFGEVTPTLLFVSLLISMGVVFELSTNGLNKLRSALCGDLKEVSSKIDQLSKQAEIDKLISAVNALYDFYQQKGDSIFGDEYIIKDLSRLRDELERLGENSYTKEKLDFLSAKAARR